MDKKNRLHLGAKKITLLHEGNVRDAIYIEGDGNPRIVSEDWWEQHTTDNFFVVGKTYLTSAGLELAAVVDYVGESKHGRYAVLNAGNVVTIRYQGDFRNWTLMD